MAQTPKNERMFDLRVVNRYLGAGRVSQDEYSAHLESLPDVADNVRPREEGGDDDGYDRPISPPSDTRRLPLSALFTRPKRDPSDDDDDDDDDDFDDDEDGDDDDSDDDAAPAEETVPTEAAPANEGAPADDAAPADEAAPAEDDAPKDA